MPAAAAGTVGTVLHQPGRWEVVGRCWVWSARRGARVPAYRVRQVEATESWPAGKTFVVEVERFEEVA